MDRYGNRKKIIDFEDIHAEVEATAMPVWAERELAQTFVDETVTAKPGVDKPFLLLTILLLAIGLVMLLSASFATENYATGEPLRIFLQQGVFAGSGIAIMLLVSRFTVRFLSRWSMTLMIISITLLVMVLLIGIRVNGATRWLGVDTGGFQFSFQPSEIAKIAVIMAFAQMAVRFGPKRMKTIKYGILPFAVITGTILILLDFQPHMSAMIIIGLTAAIMMFAGGTRLVYFVIPAVIVVAVVLFFLMPGMFGSAVDDAEGERAAPTLNLGNSHWARRINIWLDPDADPLGGGFQTRQSLNAVGSGGWLGQGLGQSRQKHDYLPEEHNDFIFAIIAEELGFVGAILILMLFLLLIVRGYWLALHAKDRYSYLIVVGITSLLAMQVFFNVAVVVNLIPATGISLPLFSYGGTALWIQLAQMGIVLAVSREIPLTMQEEFKDEREQEQLQ